jgi:hypothetical protein
LADTISGLLEGLSFLIKGMGGLSGILPVVASFMLTIFGDKVADGLKNIVYNA